MVVSNLEQPPEGRAETMPPYQWVVILAPYFLLGFAYLALVVGFINDGLAVVGTPLRAFVASAIVLAIWIIIELLIKRYSPRWISIQGPNLKIKRLGIGPRLVILGIVAPLWIPSVVNHFKVPEEVSLLPHLQYEYRSNYPQKYLRLKSSPLSSSELESVLTLHNDSKYILENVDVKIYILCDNENYNKHTMTYYLNQLEYMNIGSYSFSMLKRKDKKPLNLIEVLRALIKNQEDFDSFILPQIGKSKKLPKFNKHCSDSPANSLFIDNKAIPYKRFDAFTPRITVRRSETVPHGFDGAMLKIIVDYDINNIQFKHLLIGGMYYQYGKVSSIPAPDNEIPVRNAWSGFFKADNSLWKWKGMAHKSFSDFMLPQRVIDIVEEGAFRSNVRLPSQPESEIPLQPEDQIPQENKRFTGPRLELRMTAPPLPGEEITLMIRPPGIVPIYMGVQNNVRTPQPSFKPLN
jgi:hypothetical protein